MDLDAAAFAAYFGPVMRVTLFWGMIYFFALFMQGQVKTGGLIPGSDSYKYYLDRVFGNLIEQTIVFLVAMWVYAASVDPVDASALGWFWLCLRVGWIIIWGGAASPKPPPTIAMATMPQYITVNYMLWTPALWNGLFGFELKLKETFGGQWWSLILAVILQGMLCMMIPFLSAMLANKVFSKKFMEYASVES
mmetsp:Transcript_24823/g.78167  ORF Transcript_24823/g.78167 Transcript_24823/m.78167 type:complete len:193 (+) Transcript_24823:87-665(+)